MEQRIPMPLRLGYYLVRPDVRCSRRPAVPYRGVDRLPYLPTFEEQEALRASGRAPLAALWDRYWDAKDARTLFADRRLADKLRGAFLDEGLAFDLIYAEVARLPADIDRHPRAAPWRRLMDNVAQYMRPVQDAMPERPTDLRPLGHDLSTPAPNFHSAIFQPGLERSQPRLLDALNAVGLFGDMQRASSYMAAANAEIPRALPFCVIAVWDAT